MSALALLTRCGSIGPFTYQLYVFSRSTAYWYDPEPQYLREVLRAKQEGLKVGDYFAGSLLDNFEWAEGYRPRFGLLYVDYATQQRVIKQSGYWFQQFLIQ